MNIILDVVRGPMGIRGGGKRGFMLINDEDINLLISAISKTIPDVDRKTIKSLHARQVLDLIDPNSEVNEFSLSTGDTLFFRQGKAIEFNIQPKEIPAPQEPKL